MSIESARRDVSHHQQQIGRLQSDGAGGWASRRCTGQSGVGGVGGNKTTNLSTLASKLREAQRYNDDAAKCQKQVASNFRGWLAPVPGLEPGGNSVIQRESVQIEVTPANTKRTANCGESGKGGAELDATQTIDPIAEALATGLANASAAGRWDVVAQLARELEARRVAWPWSNVVAIGRRPGR